MKVLHIPAKINAPVEPVLSANLSKLKQHDCVCISATAQHLHEIDSAKKLLEEDGKKVVVGGQLLGCDAKAALKKSDDVDCFIHLGSGRFHPLAIAVETNKPVYIANPLSSVFDEITWEEKERWRKKRKGRIVKSAAAGVFGVLVSTKSGQFHLDKAREVKEKLEGAGKKAFLFAGDLLSPSNLMPFKVGAWVDTACPRITEDEHEKTVVTVDELKEWLQ